MLNEQTKPLYLVLDCEMTSLEPETGELLETYAEVLNDKFEVIESLKLLTKPEGHTFVVDPLAMEVNKIDLLSHSRVAKTYKQCAFSFVEFLNRNTNHGEKKLTLVGQSVDGDKNFIQTKFGISRKEWEHWMARAVLDTKRIAEFLKVAGFIPQDQSTSLAQLAVLFKLPDTEKFHTAYNDVQYTKGVLKELIKLVTAHE